MDFELLARPKPGATSAVVNPETPYLYRAHLPNDLLETFLIVPIDRWGFRQGSLQTGPHPHFRARSVASLLLSPCRPLDQLLRGNQGENRFSPGLSRYNRRSFRKTPQQKAATTEVNRCLNAARHGLSHLARVLHFLDKQIAKRHQPVSHPRPLRELARDVIDVMAVVADTRWNAVIAWQTASEALPSTPEHELAQIVDSVQWELLAT
jgi:hypothetical protein